MSATRQRKRTPAQEQAATDRGVYRLLAGTDELRLPGDNTRYYPGDEITMSRAQYSSLRRSGIALVTKEKYDADQQAAEGESDDPTILNHRLRADGKDGEMIGRRPAGELQTVAPVVTEE